MGDLLTRGITTPAGGGFRSRARSLWSHELWCAGAQHCEGSVPVNFWNYLHPPPKKKTQSINRSTSLTLFSNESVQPSGPCYLEVQLVPSGHLLPKLSKCR